jgi:non-heme chloroperoxidase
MFLGNSSLRGKRVFAGSQSVFAIRPHRSFGDANRPANGVTITEMERRKFVTSDGAALSYGSIGTGPPLVMVHGWSQTADQFRYQFDAFAAHAQVLTYDQRGHGDSERPAHGYRIHRLAMDLRELLESLDVRDAILLGHSMGCSVIWAYLELFGDSRLAKLILVDEPPCLTINPAWGNQEIAETGALFKAEALVDLCNSLADEGATGAVSDSLMTSMLTPGCPAELRGWMMECNRKMPRPLAAALMRQHAPIDWRDIIQRIRLPSLVVGAEASLAAASSIRWIAKQIPGAILEIFGADEGGSHFMFAENPKKFNRIVLDFLECAT